MKKQVRVTETITYYFEIDVSEDDDDDKIQEIAEDEWEANPARKPEDYECSIEVLE